MTDRLLLICLLRRVTCWADNWCFFRSIQKLLSSSSSQETKFGQRKSYLLSSYLSFLSKLTERVVKLRLTEYLSGNNLLNSFQFAYSKHHPTETTLLSVHDHIIKAMGRQQVTCLTLLDLSAGFETKDQSILLERFSSCFGITSTALSWIESYFLNHSFYVNVENTKSSVFQLLYGVPQGSVLGPLYSSFYTPLLFEQSYHQPIITSMLMILNFFYLSRLLIFHTISLILKTLV